MVFAFVWVMDGCGVCVLLYKTISRLEGKHCTRHALLDTGDKNYYFNQPDESSANCIFMSQ